MIDERRRVPVHDPPNAAHKDKMVPTLQDVVSIALERRDYTIEHRATPMARRENNAGELISAWCCEPDGQPDLIGCEYVDRKCTGS
jgi:hypothetical protein